MTDIKRKPSNLIQKPQEIPPDHPQSRFFFTKNLVATATALQTFGPLLIFKLYYSLQERACEQGGLDYLQVFEDTSNSEGPNLWFIEDAQAVTALLPEDY
ncbi:MAG: hypothetical protein KJ970_18530 [Candidatus Eisenbacteria bacterium]|uniref:Uncharacterized protein n=1 Tax=Eiseniibacteriota bacterium TaxID=2212470 RepID=A0A948W845_UNCEI|nr:hypothetical protein [Candidatus Eisenbacteria bacterium]MBU1947883.1 hypothetical protein [Candidatus Eisenbacteria bacterium]MBU2692920.1 hypothetical protein [Candidatus Eisenbacteria bacterium]